MCFGWPTIVLERAQQWVDVRHRDHELIDVGLSIVDAEQGVELVEIAEEVGAGSSDVLGEDGALEAHVVAVVAVLVGAVDATAGTGRRRTRAAGGHADTAGATERSEGRVEGDGGVED